MDVLTASDKRQPIVILGAPRSGAGLLQAIFRMDERWAPSALSGTDPLPQNMATHRLVGEPSLEQWDAVRSAWSEHLAEESIDWAPRWSLRALSLAAIDPSSKFIVVLRDPRRAVASLVEAWRSGRFISVAELPSWWGDKWSFPLIEEWPQLVGKPLHDVAAAQWFGIQDAIREDLAAIDPSRWVAVTYESLIADPLATMRDLGERLSFAWSAPSDEVGIPLSPNTVSRPGEFKWQRDVHEVLTALQARGEQHRAFLEFAAGLGATGYREPLVVERKPQVPTRVSTSSDRTAFRSEHSRSLVELLQQSKSSIVLSTYKSGHVIIARARSNALDTNVFSFARPMGLAVAGPRMAIGTEQAIETLWNQPTLAAVADPASAHDSVFVPRTSTHTGDVQIHEMGFDRDGALWFVNTRFSCLAKQNLLHSFTPVWRPNWITSLAAEDRCHLNGMAMVNGRPKYVTALAQTDIAHGWREHKGTSGVIVDIDTDRVVATGLSMPHSPRWHDDRLWVLQSGLGTLSTVDVGTGALTTIAVLPGFTRGLAFIGPYALIGLSQVRESVFKGLPITEQAAERNCGVWLVDTRTGSIVGQLRFEGAVQEIFDVQVLAGDVWPTILAAGPATLNSFVLAPEAVAELAQPSIIEPESQPPTSRPQEKASS